MIIFSYLTQASKYLHSSSSCAAILDVDLGRSEGMSHRTAEPTQACRSKSEGSALGGGAPAPQTKGQLSVHKSHGKSNREAGFP